MNSRWKAAIYWKISAFHQEYLNFFSPWKSRWLFLIFSCNSFVIGKLFIRMRSLKKTKLLLKNIGLKLIFFLEIGVECRKNRALKQDILRSLTEENYNSVTLINYYMFRLFNHVFLANWLLLIRINFHLIVSKKLRKNLRLKAEN